jgi:phospholipase C
MMRNDMTDSNFVNPSGGTTRRRFVASAAAVAGAAGLAGVLPESLARAATAAPKEFDLSQVKHLVFLMQENRSFDHYFGTFPGARGYSDPTAIRLPTGNPVFQQPDPANPDGYLEPYHMSTITTGAAAVPSLSHDWRDQHASWNQGAMDGWLLTHIAADGDANGSFTMGYYEEEDLPFHWALAKAFTLCDNYHCSVMGPTTPNRLFWEDGGIDQQGLAGGPVLETSSDHTLTYETGAETLWNAGITFKFYQVADWDDYNNYPQFVNFQTPGLVAPEIYASATADGTLWGDGTPGGLGDPANPTPASDPNLAFEEDCANGVLPDVSYIGSASDEHPPHLPAGGAQFLASKLEALAASEDLWNSTLFIINYDENDGIFDHVPPPVPDPVKYPEEYVTKASTLGTPGGGLPVGAGFRVPAFVISPWTTGGQIFSEVSDHTSCLRLIEAVANAGGLSGKQTATLHFPNVTRWRRATFSDFTSALRPGAGQPAPASTQFDAATTAANLAAQTTASAQPMPARPGAGQQVSLTIGPAVGLALQPGASATVQATFSNNGPGTVRKVSLALGGAPSGWTIAAASRATAAALAAESSFTPSWTVTASAGTGSQFATLSATATYAEAAGGGRKTITAEQVPAPSITSVSPATASAGDIVTVTGVNFGTGQGAGYIAFSDYGVNWGAPGNSSTFVLNTWSDTAITFTVPEPSGTDGKWEVIPGTTATVKVTSSAGITSSPASLAIATTGSAPVLTSLSPTTAAAGDTVTITGSNFGTTQGTSFVAFSDGTVNWGAPDNSAKLTVDSWSDSQITFTVPVPSGSDSVTSGSTATVTVFTAGGPSSTATLTIS